jgi:hypothetical protein
MTYVKKVLGWILWPFAVIGLILWVLLSWIGLCKGPNVQ